jgi:methylenetetrahydrofolate dehydrogenase (NADP+) / methenyltetrahydrofolate cyclohydrolase
MPNIIDGDELAAELRAEIEEEVSVLRLSAVRPGLATVLVGEDQGAHWYERHLRRLAEGLDYRYVCEQLEDYVTLDDVVATIGKLNADPRITGILVLRPLPPQIPEYQVSAAVDPRKDVEGMHPWNLGLLAMGTPRFVPSTPAACFYLLDAYARSRELKPISFYRGKTLVIVGRSMSVGKPLAFLGLQRDATVVVCHSRTAEAGHLAEHTARAQILVAAAGQPGLIRGDMVSEGVVVVDVGTNAVQDPVSGDVFLTGDIDRPSVSPKAEALTPVPGGVGPVTDVWLIGNVLAAAAMTAQMEPRFGALITRRLLLDRD